MLNAIHRQRSDLALGFVVSLVGIAVGLAGCGASGPASSSSPTARPTPVTSATPNVAKISNNLLSAENKMIDADNANLANFNSQAAATETAGINATIQDHQTFDSALSAISFPSADGAAVTAVLSADAAYESSLGTLAVNTGDVTNYNSVFDTMVPLQSAFEAALTTLDGDFGITAAASPTTTP
jgi:hypothetical protein